MDLPDRRISLDEYRALAAVSPDRLEYRDGRAVALGVPTKNHARITGTLAITLGSRVRANGCDFFAGNAEVATPSGDRLIPDFVVTSDERDRVDAGDDQSENVIRHPWLVIQVLSSATAAADVMVKFDSYRTVAELTHYVVIDSCRRGVRLYERLADGRFTKPEPVERLMLPTLSECALSLDDIYSEDAVTRLLTNPVAMGIFMREAIDEGRA